MKAAVLIALSAAMLLCGCTITPQAEKNNEKPVAKEYEDEVPAEPVIEPVVVQRDYTEPEYGQPLVYEDFCLNDYDFLNERLNEEQNLFAYTYWAGYDEDELRYRSLTFFSRMNYNDRMEDIAEEYGTEILDYDPSEDNILLWARLSDNYDLEYSARESEYYCDMKYPLPGLAKPFEQYAGMRLYFDEYGDLTLAVMYLNDDLMPLIQIRYDDFSYRKGYWTDELPDPDGETLIPRVMLEGMVYYRQMNTDVAYPCFSFEEGMVTVNWYDSDGNPAEGQGALKNGLKIPYTIGEKTLDFELPEGGDSMETYISYNSYLGTYELHDPYWRDNYNCTLLLGRSLQQEVGD